MRISVRFTHGRVAKRMLSGFSQFDAMMAQTPALMAGVIPRVRPPRCLMHLVVLHNELVRKV